MKDAQYFESLGSDAIKDQSISKAGNRPSPHFQTMCAANDAQLSQLRCLNQLGNRCIDCVHKSISSVETVLCKVCALVYYIPSGPAIDDGSPAHG